jgi:hypothetical protein
MAQSLQVLFDQVSALLRELRDALEDHAVFRSRRDWFDEYLNANELELALHTACAALMDGCRELPSGAVLQKVKELHESMNLRDDCVERLLTR